MDLSVNSRRPARSDRKGKSLPQYLKEIMVWTTEVIALETEQQCERQVQCHTLNRDDPLPAKGDAVVYNWRNDYDNKWSFYVVSTQRRCSDLQELWNALVPNQ